MTLEFTVTHRESKFKARAATLKLPHATIETPCFMPVGTVASVKSLAGDDMESLGYNLMLSNTYHLMLRPGVETIKECGGLHNFMAWPHAILTDSGGFQAFSLAKIRKLTEQGVTFRSHINGALNFLGPEEAVYLQEAYGVDIAMMLDVCPPGGAPKREVAQNLEMVTRWGKRCIEARKHPDTTNFFGIIQGGIYPDLRAEAAEKMCALPFDGFAIGGVAVGEDPVEIAKQCNYTAPLMPENKPRYLMGVGTPKDIALAVAAGVDMFDCVMPTRNARNGYLFVPGGHISIKRQEFINDMRPLDETCTCLCCRRFSRAYLRHLFVAKELLYYRLASLHNLAFYKRHLAQLRQAIIEDRLAEVIAPYLKEQEILEEEQRRKQA